MPSFPVAALSLSEKRTTFVAYIHERCLFQLLEADPRLPFAQSSVSRLRQDVNGAGSPPRVRHLRLPSSSPPPSFSARSAPRSLSSSLLSICTYLPRYVSILPTVISLPKFVPSVTQSIRRLDSRLDSFHARLETPTRLKIRPVPSSCLGSADGNGAFKKKSPRKGKYQMNGRCSSARRTERNSRPSLECTQPGPAGLGAAQRPLPCFCSPALIGHSRRPPKK